MPSPFPGMDPYLEGPEWWSTFHSELAHAIRDHLAAKVRPSYVVFAEKNYTLDVESVDDQSEFRPDVAMFNIAANQKHEPGSVAVAAPLKVTYPIPTEVPHFTIRILSVAGRKLVTIIELISPTNKRGEGYKKYLRKRRRLLTSDTHLMEIDLHRKGRRPPVIQPLPPAPYFVFLSRAQKRPAGSVWPIALEAPLPTVPVPLDGTDADVALELQPVFDALYDRVDFELVVDYSKPPEIRLEEPVAAWADERIKAWKQRTRKEP